MGTVFEGAMRFPVQVRFPERVRLDPRRLGEIRVAAPAAEPGGPPRMIPLLFVAAILGLLAGLRRVTADAGRRWPVWAWRVPTYAVRTVAAFSEGIGRP